MTWPNIEEDRRHVAQALAGRDTAGELAHARRMRHLTAAYRPHLWGLAFALCIVASLFCAEALIDGPAPGARLAALLWGLLVVAQTICVACGAQCMKDWVVVRASLRLWDECIRELEARLAGRHGEGS